MADTCTCSNAENKGCCFIPMMGFGCMPCGGGTGGGTGADGKSAYELAVENGFTGTLEEWLESLKGKDGAVFSSPMNFSLEEQAVGTWIDGKTIYSKTIKWTAGLPGLGGTKVVEHNIPGVDSPLRASGHILLGQDGFTVTVPCISMSIGMSKTHAKLYSTDNGWASSGTDCYITFHYTCTDR